MAENFWYSYDRICGYDATFSFILSERGCGKTYGALKMVIRDFIKNGNEFIYLRRYKSELNKAVPKLFDAIIRNKEFPDYNFKVEANKFFIQAKEEEGCKDSWIKIGEAVALSTASILKSSDFSGVKTIVFDEFLLSTGIFHYLKNEVETLLDVVETIGRLRDIRVFFLGNSISITNPYFAYFGLSLPYNSEFKTFKDGLIVVNYAKNPAYREKKHQSKFGRLISGTNYASYAIDNEWLNDESGFIGKKLEGSRNFSVLVVNKKKYGVWKCKTDGRIYISEDYDPNNPCVFSFDIKDHKEDNVLISAKRSPWFRLVIEEYKLGNVWFENMNIKNIFLRYLAKCF